MIKSAVDNKCLIFSGNGNDKHPSRHDWGSGNEFCGFPGGKSALLNNKQGVFVITGLTGTFPSTACHVGQYWCDKLSTAGLTSPQVGAVTEQEKVWYYNGQSTGVGKGQYNEACDSTKVVCAGVTTFGTATNQATAVKEAIANGGVHPNAPTTPGDGAPATTVMIKSALDAKCVIFSGNGNDKHPSRHDWGSGNEFCGFPGGKSALLNNKQGVFELVNLESNKYMIKSAVDNKCLIFSGNGNDKHPSRHDWGSGNEFCGFPGGKSALLNNKQGV